MRIRVWIQIQVKKKTIYLSQQKVGGEFVYGSIFVEKGENH